MGMKRGAILRICLVAAAALMLPPAGAFAQGGTTIQAGHSGSWYNAAQNGHGLFAEVLDDASSPTGKRLLLAWYAFLDGQQVWILATGPVLQNAEGQIAVMTAWIYEGNDFPPNFNPNLLDEIVWGEIRMWFLGCQSAVIEWDSIINGFGSGELAVQRLTTISGTECDPEQGGEQPPDDHGNSWPTATSFPVQAVYNNFIEGRLERRDDVDVFIFTIQSAQQLAIFTSGSSDTFGTLYAIVNNQEMKLEEDDDDGTNDNFFIGRQLNPGLYSIHVTGTLTGIYGAYRIYLQTN